MEKVPDLQFTPAEDIPEVVNRIRSTFHSHKTRSVEYRLTQLRKLYWGLKDNEAAVVEACKRDLGKSHFETYLTEIGWCENDIIFMCKNLPKWVKDESAPNISLTNRPVAPKIKKDPMGTVLIIGAYNFPIQLSLGPFIGAIAAGCTAVLKPSENAPAAAAVMEMIIKDYLDPSAYTVVQGGIPESTALLDQKWDKIFYTGSAGVGTIIAKKAAETLTPVTLELGGRNPAIITKHADPRLAARRLLWAKLLNAGQVCVSQNYILVDREILPAFLEELKKAQQEFFPQGVKNSPDYGRIVNERQWQRLKKMLDQSSGKILLGGTMDEKEKFLEPTVVQVDDPTDSLMVDESFGPLIPIYPVNDLDEAIKMANEVHDTPLGIYPFGTKQEAMKVLNETRSGGASINDGFFHASIPTLAFGGVGSSGSGAYRGKASFDSFTHRRSYTTTPGWMEGLLKIRYPPYAGKIKQFKRMNDLKPNFDREGRVRYSLLSWLLTLGTGSTSGAVKRYILVAILAMGLRQYLQRQSKL
ncbi:aldehyde dehydrogenase [Viridothelium virens]|uniref:Aldehyde dehydrogenase n=1 Tax=Viridothelium virens TaxID=1048519 RepID=A0A6A6HIM5_VIRVR|nr:aldehyde dehydrogenase [Viridothelium virens]